MFGKVIVVISDAFAADPPIVAVVDVHSFRSTSVTVSAAKVIRTVRTACPGTTVVALGSRVALAAQAMDADILLDAGGTSLRDLADISSAAEHRTPRELHIVPGSVHLEHALWKAVLALLAQGQDNLKIAAELSIAERTVKAHVASLMKKLAADNRTELALLGRDAGFGPARR